MPLSFQARSSRCRICTAPLIAALSLIAFTAHAPAAYAQEDHALEVGLSLSAAASSGEELPFWLVANRYGTVDPHAANIGTRIGVRRPLSGTGRFDYGFGADLLGRLSDRSTLHAHQLYGRLRYRSLQLTAGRYEQMIGQVDTSLTLGSVTWSANASPMPKISLSTAGYVTVPGTRRHLSISGYVAHGWLEEERFVRDPYVHEKYLYLRLLPGDAPLTLHAGIIHHAQWAGVHPMSGPQPDSFRNFLGVVVGRGVSGERSGEVPSFTNHLAAYDLSAEARISNYRVLAYRHFYHEDTPSLLFRNPWDGLWGVSIRRSQSDALVTGLLWEHLVMTRHNAKYSEGEERGADTYYNHSFYRSGWTYRGRTLGIPLMRSAEERPGLDNNIVVAHHLGLEGSLPANVSYRLFATYSRNYGAQKVCSDADCTSRRDERTPRRDQYSVLLELAGSLSERYGVRFNTGVAFDAGELYDNRIGLSAGLSWTGRIVP